MYKGIFSILSALLFLSAPAYVLAADSAVPSIRYFQYWVKCGDKAECPGQYRNFSFELASDRMSVFGIGSHFCGAVDKSVSLELSQLVAGLDLQNLEGAVSKNSSCKDAFALLDTYGEKNCVWSLRIIFREDEKGNVPAEIHLFGMDDGSSPKRLQLEDTLTRFFTAQCERAQAETPRVIEMMNYRTGSGENAVRYGLYADEGKVRLERRRQGEKITEYVNGIFFSGLTR